MHKPGVMATVPGITNSRVPLKSISPTHSGEGPTEDEVDSPTPSSTASEPTDQFFPSPKSNQRSTNHRRFLEAGQLKHDPVCWKLALRGV